MRGAYRYYAEKVLNGSWEARRAVQFLFWETLENKAVSCENGVVQGLMNEMREAGKNWQTKPSFDGQTIEVNIGETVTLNDANGILGDTYNGFSGTISSSNGIDVQKDGNTLKITCTSAEAADESNIVLNKYPDEYSGESYIYHSNLGGQEMRFYRAAANLQATVHVKVNKAKLQIQKKDLDFDGNETGAMVAGAKFKVSKNADMSDPIGEYATGSDSKTQIIEGLQPGTYYVQETYVPGAWVVDSTVKSVDVKASTPEVPVTTFTQKNARKWNYVSVKKEDADTPVTVEGVKYDKQEVSNAVFGIYYAQGPLKDTEVAGARMTSVAGKEVKSVPLCYYGDAVGDNQFKYNQYYVKEITAPTNYWGTTDQKNFTINKDNETFTFTATNKETKGWIDVNKSDTVGGDTPLGDASFAGAQYTLYAAEDILAPWDNKTVLIKKDAVVHTFTIQADGSSNGKAEGLYLGKYYLKETKLPTAAITSKEGSLFFNGMHLDSTATCYNWDTTRYEATLSYENQDEHIALGSQTFESGDKVISQPFKLVKVTNTEGSTVNKPLAGAKFKVMLQKEFLAKLQELKPSGVTTYDELIALPEAKRIAAIDQITAATPAARDKDNNDVAELETNDKGIANSPSLPFGTYLAVETYCPDDYLKSTDPIIVKIDKQSDNVDEKVYTFGTDTTIQSRIRLVKKDKQYGEIVQKSTTFKIMKLTKNADGSFTDAGYVQQKIGGKWTEEFKTYEDGYSDYFETPQVLDAGWYRVDEWKPPVDYLDYDADPQAASTVFEIKDNASQGTYDPVDRVQIITIEINNITPKAEIKVDKHDINNADTKVNATFKLTAAQDIYMPYLKPDGTVEATIKYHKGDVIQNVNNEYGDANVIGGTDGIYKTDGNGQLDITGLPMGSLLSDPQGASYTLTEVSVQDGYLNTDIDDNGNVASDVKDQTYGHYSKTVTFIKGKTDNTTTVYPDEFKVLEMPTIINVNKEDANTGDKLGGAHLAVYKDDGNGQPAGDKLVEWDSVAGESYQIYGKLAPGKYILVEETAPAGYIKANNVAFTVEETGLEQNVTIKNDYTKAEFAKVKAGTDQKIGGATLQILDAGGNVVQAYADTKFTTKVNCEWTTEADKTKMWYGLPAGTYTLRETKAPNGYLTAADQTFTITDTYNSDGTIPTAQVSMADDYTGIELSKIDMSGVADITAAPEMKGVNLELYQADKTTIAKDMDGNECKWTTDGTKHQIFGLAPGTYYLKEASIESSVAHYQDYVLPTEMQEITVDNTGYVAAGNVAQSKDPMVNYYTSMSIIKKSSYDGTALAGATLAIYNANGEKVVEWVTDANGKAIQTDANKAYVRTDGTIGALPEGYYTLHEEKAPAGYLLSKDVSFTLTKKDNVKTIEMTDMPFDMDFLKIYVEDEKHTPVVKNINDTLYGVTMGVYDADGYIKPTETTESPNTPIVKWNTADSDLIEWNNGVFGNVKRAKALAKVILSTNSGLEAGKTYVYGEVGIQPFIQYYPESIYFKVDYDASGNPVFYYWNEGGDVQSVTGTVKDRVVDGVTVGSYYSFCDENDSTGTLTIQNLESKSWDPGLIKAQAVDSTTSESLSGANFELYVKVKTNEKVQLENQSAGNTLSTMSTGNALNTLAANDSANTLANSDQNILETQADDLDAIYEWVSMDQWVSEQGYHSTDASWLGLGTDIKIEESVAPEGYNLADPVVATITKDNLTTEETADGTISVLKVDVPHNKLESGSSGSETTGTTTTGTKVTSNANTGTTSDMTTLFLAMALVAAGSGLGYAVYRKRR